MIIQLNPVTFEEYEQYQKTPDIENSITWSVFKEVNNILALGSLLFLVDVLQDDERYKNGPDDEAYPEIDRLKDGIIDIVSTKSQKIAYANRLAYLQDKPTGIGRFKNLCNRVVRVVLLGPKTVVALFLAISILFTKEDAKRLYIERKIADVMGYTPFFLKNGRRSLDQLNELISSIENKLYKPESLTPEGLATLKKTFAGS